MTTPDYPDAPTFSDTDFSRRSAPKSKLTAEESQELADLMIEVDDAQEAHDFALNDLEKAIEWFSKTKSTLGSSKFMLEIFKNKHNLN